MVLNFSQGARAYIRRSGKFRHWNRLLEQMGGRGNLLRVFSLSGKMCNSIKFYLQLNLSCQQGLFRVFKYSSGELNQL